MRFLLVLVLCMCVVLVSCNGKGNSCESFLEKMYSSFSKDSATGYSHGNKYNIAAAGFFKSYLECKGTPVDIDMMEFGQSEYKVSKNNKWGMIDRAGKLIVPIEYEYLDRFIGDFTAAKKDGKWGVINKAGDLITPASYDSVNIEAMDRYYGGRIAVMKNDKWALVNTSGKLITDIVYKEVGTFSDNLASVKMGDKWGYIDSTGRVVIPFQFDFAFPFKEQLASVAKIERGNGDLDFKLSMGFIDKTGKIVIPMQYDIAYPFRDGKAEVEKSNKRFYIDKTGKYAGGYENMPEPAKSDGNKGVTDTLKK